MHSLAKELNNDIRSENDSVFAALSSLGKALYFPKGILTQTAEAKQKAKKFNATIGIAKEKGTAMHLPSLMNQLPSLTPDEAINYAPSYGNPELRAEWKKRIEAKNPSLDGAQLSLPVVTCGITHGLSLVADLFVDADDTVLIPDKVWGNYNMVFGVRRGAKMKPYRLLSDSGGFDVAGFAKTLEGEKGTKLVVVLNFPNNPTGYTVTEEEATGIANALMKAAAAERPVVVICDDAYFDLFHDDKAFHESVFTKLVRRKSNLIAIKLDGATKEDYVWGFRVGFVTFAAMGGEKLYAALEKKAGACIRGAISNDSQLAQSLLLKTYRHPDFAKEKKEKQAVMKARYEKSKEVLSRPIFNDVWSPYPFNSGYFLCVRLKKLNAEEYRLRLLDKYGIGVIATSPTDIRVAYSCLDVDQIEPLFTQMRECALELSKDVRASDLSLHREAFEE